MDRSISGNLLQTAMGSPELRAWFVRTADRVTDAAQRAFGPQQTTSMGPVAGALVAGVAVGGVAAMALSPSVRKAIGGHVTRARDTISEVFESSIERAESRISELAAARKAAEPEAKPITTRGTSDVARRHANRNGARHA